MGRAPAHHISDAVRAHRYAYANERELQDSIARVLEHANFADVEREVELGCGRIDFLVGRVGVEVKVDGGPAAVGRQLRRYAQSALIDSLVLVTNRAKHARLAGYAHGKPVLVVGVLEPF